MLRFDSCAPESLYRPCLPAGQAPSYLPSLPPGSCIRPLLECGPVANRPLLTCGPILCGLLSGLVLLALLARGLGLVVALFLIRGAFLIRGPLARGLGMLASSDFRPSAGESLFRLVLGSSCRCYATHCSGRPPDGKGVAAHLTKCCADETYTYALFPIIYRCFSESPNSLIVLGHFTRSKTRFTSIRYAGGGLHDGLEARSGILGSSK